MCNFKHNLDAKAFSFDEIVFLTRFHCQSVDNEIRKKNSLTTSFEHAKNRDTCYFQGVLYCYFQGVFYCYFQLPFAIFPFVR
jgi:hypothetical protein